MTARTSTWTVYVRVPDAEHAFARDATSYADAQKVADEMLAQYPSAPSAWIVEKEKLPPSHNRRKVEFVHRYQLKLP